MQHGFVKVCAATPKIRVADVPFNTQNIIAAIGKAEKKGAQLIVFPELCICGYTCGDLFSQPTLLNCVEEGLEKVKLSTEGKKALVFVGAPVSCLGKLYNCAVAISGGKILGIVPKTFLPNYGEFYERRHFSPAQKGISKLKICGEEVAFGTKLIFSAENFKEFTVACEICEDLWSPESPSVYHAMAGANIIVNLSCSDETAGKAEYRRDLVRMQSGKLVGGYVYADAGDGESTTDMVFAGHNIIAENAKILAESKLFENGEIYAEIDVQALENERRRMASGFFDDGRAEGYSFINFLASEEQGELTRDFPKLPFVPQKSDKLAERTELILSIQSKGLEKRLEHTCAKTAVIGISGGLDSALAFLVACRAFKALNKPLSDIIAVTMPGFGTTNKTKNNSIELINSLGATARTISIKDSVLKHFEDIGHNPEKTDTPYENAQARTRTLILMDIANETGGLVIGTGDLSELALGWATYNGDHMSMYAVNSSVPKTLVKHLVAYEAKKIGGEAERILNDILNTEISPELLPPTAAGDISQKTEDLVGPYILHDFFLYYAIRMGYPPAKVQYIAEKTFKGDFDAETIKKWLKNFYKRFFSQQFKRSCVPDGVKVGTLTLSPRGDWRMPSDGVPAIWLADIK